MLTADTMFTVLSL